MKWVVNQNFIQAVKDVMSVTQGTNLNITFNKGNCTVKSFLSYFGAKIDCKVEGQDNDSFDIDGSLLVKAFDKKEKVTLSKEENSNVLCFSVGKLKGEFSTNTPTDFEILTCTGDSEVLKLSRTFKDTLFSVFDKFQINSKKVNLDKLDLQMTCKDGNLLYFLGDPYYIAMYEEKGTDFADMKSRILLKYMTTIQKIFKNDTEFSIGISNGIVCVEGTQAILNFPQISFDDEMISIEDLENHKNTYFGGNPESMVLIEAEKMLPYIKQCMSMFDGEGTFTLQNKGNTDLNCTVISPYGNLEESFECKIKGEFNKNLDLPNFADCLQKLEKSTVKLSFYQSCCLVRSKENPNVSYILSYAV